MPSIEARDAVGVIAASGSHGGAGHSDRALLARSRPHRPFFLGVGIYMMMVAARWTA
jgi:hypothetical protein